MRLTHFTVFTAAIAIFGPMAMEVHAQGEQTAAGWIGKADGTEGSVGDAKLTQEGDSLHVTTGPAVTYWNPANKAAGDYTVKATFTEPKYMGLNDHPHPYGIVVAGNDLGTAEQ